MLEKDKKKLSNPNTENIESQDSYHKELEMIIKKSKSYNNALKKILANISQETLNLK